MGTKTGRLFNGGALIGRFADEMLMRRASQSMGELATLCRYATGLTGHLGSSTIFGPNSWVGGLMAENGENLHGSLSEEILSLIESDTRFWNDAADRCEHVAGTVADERENGSGN